MNGFEVRLPGRDYDHKAVSFCEVNGRDRCKKTLTGGDIGKGQFAAGVSFQGELSKRFSLPSDIRRDAGKLTAAPSFQVFCSCFVLRLCGPCSESE